MFERVAVRGTDLYYQDTGNGRPLVFLHGFSGNHLSWFQQIPAFAGDYRCIAPDQRMFGRSVDAPNGDGAGAFVEDLTAVFDHCGIDRATIIGHSMSGWITTSFVTQYPARAAGVILSGTPGGILSWEQHDTLQVNEAALPAVDPLSTTLGFLADSITELNTDAPASFDSIRPVLEEYPIDPDTVAAHPVLLIAGEADPFMPPPVVRAVSDRLGGPTAHIVEGAGHSVNFEQPTEFNTTVRDFLNDLPRE